jgi:lambda family phage minor tail protein L
MPVPISELQSVAPSAIIECFVLELFQAQHGINETHRFHAGTNITGGDLVWAGNTYRQWPVSATGFKYSGKGQLPRPTLRISNVLGSITAIIATLPDGLDGARVTRIRTHARFLDAVNFPGGVNPYGTPDPTAEALEIFYVDRKAAENREVVEYEIASIFDLAGVRGPKRQCIADPCQWRYRQWNAATGTFDYSKATECGYNKAAYFDANNNPVSNPAQDVCSLALAGCEARFGVFTRIGTATVGSNVLTLDATISITDGEMIRGWGLPTGTTVSSVTSSTSLVLSNAATASSSASKTGTVSANSALMVVSNTTGLGVGMAISGPYLAGATITWISGTTLALSHRPYQLARAATAFVGLSGRLTLRRITIDTSGLSTGMRVFGSAGIDTTIASIGLGFITLASYGNKPAHGTPLTLYFLPASPAASTYSFTADATYAFRDSLGELPYGSFPGMAGGFA